MTIRALALMAALVAASPAFAQPAGDTGTVLHLSEQADRVLPQDRLRADLRAEVTDADATKVQAQINRLMDAALQRAKAVTSVKTATGSYSVYQDRLPGQAANQPLHWRGSQGLTLSGSDAGAILTLAGDLQKAGLLMSGMTWQLAPETAKAAEDELTAVALTRLRQRAEKIAATLGMSVGGYKEIRVGNASEIGAPRFRMAAASAAAPMPTPPPVAAAGEDRVTVTVEADVLLKSSK